ALGHQPGRDGVDNRSRGDWTQIVIVGEIEERFVASVIDLRYVDRTADAAAGLAKPVLGTGTRGIGAILVYAPAGSFQPLLSHAVDPGSVQRVGARARVENLDAAAGPAVFSRVGTHQKLEFTERFRGGWIEHRATRLRDHVAGAVDQLLARTASG